MNFSNLVLIGLTGGIATGKSTVLEVLRDAGCVVVDADRLGHKAYLPGTECLKQLVKCFGEQIVGEDGFVDRKALGGIIFSDPSAREKLNQIVWPAIRDLALQEFQTISETLQPSETKIVILEAAILIEAGWTSVVDEVWVTYTDPSTQISRLVARNNITDIDAEKRVNAQISNSERKRSAHVLLENNDTSEALVQMVKKEFKALEQRFKSENAFELVYQVSETDDTVIRSLKYGTLSAFNICTRHVYVLVKAGEKYVTRSSDTLSLMYKTYVKTDESNEAAARREVVDQLGVSGEPKFCGKLFHKDKKRTCWVYILVMSLSTADMDATRNSSRSKLMSLQEINEIAANSPKMISEDDLQAFRQGVTHLSSI